MKTKVRKCLICGVRPSNGQAYCSHCSSQIEADKRRNAKPKPFKYVTWRGDTLEFRANGKGTFTATPVRRDPDKLPKKLTINLNGYCDGFTRDQVKKFKRAFRQAFA